MYVNLIVFLSWQNFDNVNPIVYEIICVVKITIKYVDECTSIGALTTLKISKSRIDTNSEIAKIK